MAKFSKDNQPANRGRPKGAKGKRSAISEPLQKAALNELEKAVLCGEAWAVQSVIDRIAPKLKAITPENSLDAEMLSAKIRELTELEERIAKLESMK